MNTCKDPHLPLVLVLLSVCTRYRKQYLVSHVPRAVYSRQPVNVRINTLVRLHEEVKCTSTRSYHTSTRIIIFLNSFRNYELLAPVRDNVVDTAVSCHDATRTRTTTATVLGTAAHIIHRCNVIFHFLCCRTAELLLSDIQQHHIIHTSTLLLQLSAVAL